MADVNNSNINVTITPNLNVTTTISPNAVIEAIITPGARGKSAYEIWLEDGHTGTTTDFLNWLRHDYYHYTKITASTVWTITHNLSKYPSVSVVDSAGALVVGEILYLNENQLQVSFNIAFSGEAYLN